MLECFTLCQFCSGKKGRGKGFFMGKGVEYQKIGTGKFNTVEQADKFQKAG